MSNEKVITDRRLLAALDYIDQKYIDDVFSIIKEPEAAGEPENMTWRTPFKHWRQFAALAACILLLSLASPLVSYIAEVIRDFNAGAGSGTTEELSDAITDENGVPYTYPMFVDDLEPLTAEEMLEIDAMWVQREYSYEYNYEYNRHLLNGRDESYAIEKATIQAKNCSEKARHRFFNEVYFERYRYYGKFGDCLVLVLVGNLDVYTEYSIAGYTLSFSSSATVFVIKNDTIYDLREAYDFGFLEDSDIATLANRNIEYDKFIVEWRKEIDKNIKSEE